MHTSRSVCLLFYFILLIGSTGARGRGRTMKPSCLLTAMRVDAEHVCARLWLKWLGMLHMQRLSNASFSQQVIYVDKLVQILIGTWRIQLVAMNNESSDEFNPDIKAHAEANTISPMRASFGGDDWSSKWRRNRTHEGNILFRHKNTLGLKMTDAILRKPLVITFNAIMLRCIFA